MKKILLLIIAIFASVVLGLFLKDAPSYVLLSYKTWVVETSLWMGIILLVLSFFLVHKGINLLYTLINLPGVTNRWLRKRKVRKSLSQTRRGLLKLAEGDYKSALYLLTKSAVKQRRPLINYLSAAKAAQELGNVEKRDECLKLAYESATRKSLPTRLVQARLQLANHEYEAALATLNTIVQKKGLNKEVLRNLLECNIKLRDWHGVIKLLPDLHRYHVIRDDEGHDYEVIAAVNYLHSLDKNLQTMPYAENFNDFQAKVNSFYTRELSKASRTNSEIVQAYSHCLVQAFEHFKNQLGTDDYSALIDKLLAVIEKAISAHSTAHSEEAEESLRTLYGLYGEYAFTNVHLKSLEKHLKNKEYCLDLILNLGKLAVKLDDDEKAYQYLNQAKKLSTDTNSDQTFFINYHLARVLIKLGKQEEAHAVIV